MSQSTVQTCAFIKKSLSLYWLGLYEASSIKVYPTLFHADYSGELSSSESAGLYFSLMNLTFVAAMIIFLGLFTHLGGLLLYVALCYGFYDLAATIIPLEMTETSNAGTMKVIMVKVFIGFCLIRFLTIVLIASIAILAPIVWVISRG